MKNKKDDILTMWKANDLTMWIFLIIMFLLFMGVMLYFSYSSEKEGTEECKEDCEKLDMEFFKWQSASFGSSSECWCKINKEVKQIW